jgi:hypothetical protein
MATRSRIGIELKDGSIKPLKDIGSKKGSQTQEQICNLVII